MGRQSGVATRTAGQETVEDVDQPESTTEGLVLEELVGVGLVRVGMDDAKHLGHTGSLAKVDVSAHSIAAAPFMDDEQAQRLDVGKAGLVQALHDQTDGLRSKVLGRSSAAPMGAVAADDQGRVPALFSSQKMAINYITGLFPS